MENRAKICVCYVISAFLIILFIYSLLFTHISMFTKLKRLEYEVEEIAKMVMERNLDEVLLSQIDSCVKERTRGFWNELTVIKRKLEVTYGRLREDEVSDGKRRGLCKTSVKDLSDIDREPPSYSMVSLGASIVDVDDIPLYPTNIFLSFFGVRYNSNYPRRILEPSMELGHCYAFKGNKSTFVIKLSHRVIIQSITVEHIAAHKSLTGDTSNAPKKFQIYGTQHPTPNGDTFLGIFQYDNSLKNRAQTFSLSNEIPYKYCKIRVSSNHGNEHHTCIYRIAIHGKLP